MFDGGIRVHRNAPIALGYRVLDFRIGFNRGVTLYHIKNIVDKREYFDI